MPLSIGDKVEIVGDNKIAAYGEVVEDKNSESRYKVKVTQVVSSASLKVGDTPRVRNVYLKKLQGGRRTRKHRKSGSRKRKTRSTRK